MRVLAEDQATQTIETDGGQIVVLPRGLAAPGAIPPPPAGTLPQGVLDFLAPPRGLDIPTFPGGAAPATDVLPPSSPAIVAPPGFALPSPEPPASGPVPTRFGIAGGGAGPAPAAAPTPGEAAAPAALPSLAQSGAEGAAALGQQEQAAQQANALDQQQLAETGVALQGAAQRRAAIADELEVARQKDIAELERRTMDLDRLISKQASEPIDPERRYKRMGTAEQIATGIAAMLVGIGQGLSGQGGPNPILERLRSEVENDVRAQMADREERAQKIGMTGQQIDRYRTLAGDRVASFNARMAEEMERLAKDLEARAATYGSQKAQANALKIASDFRAKRNDYLTNAAATQWDRDLASRKQGEVERSARAEERLRGWSIAEQKRQADNELRYRYNALALDAAKLENQGRADEAKALKAAADKAFEQEIPGTVGKGGQPVLARSPKEAQALRDERAAVEATAPVLDEMIRILESGTPPSKIAQSPEWQKLQADGGAAIAGINRVMLGGVLREGDIKFAEQKLLGGDITGWEAIVRGAIGNNASTGLRQTRKNLVDRFNKNLNAQDTEAKPYEIKSLSGLPGTADTEAGAAYRRVVSGQTPQEISEGGRRSAAGELLANSPGGVAARAVSQAVFGSSKSPEAAEQVAAEESGFTLPTVTKTQEKDLLDLGRRAAGGDEDARQQLLALGSSPRQGLARGALFAAAEHGDLPLVEQITANMGASADKQGPAGTLRARQVAIGAQVGRVAELAAGGDAQSRAALLSMTQSQDADVKRAATQALAEIVGRKGK